jgi:hypothetical protein
LGQPANAVDQSGVEIEDDWLASFETQPTDSSAADVSPEPAQSASEGGEWLSSFISDSAPAQVTDGGDDWLGTLGIHPLQDEGVTAGQAVESAESDDDWLGSLGIGQQSPVEPAGAELEERHGRMFQAAAQFPKAADDQKRDTGILDQSSLPDWLAAVPAEEAQPEAGGTLDEVDFASLGAVEGESEGEALAVGETPNWLVDMKPSGLRSEPPAATQTPLGDLDFSSVAAAPQAADSGDPDWLKDFATAQEGAPADQTISSPNQNLSLDSVAQPANLVNTNADSGKPTPSASFKFESKPAWMRKKKSTGQPPKAADNEMPDWLKE